MALFFLNHLLFTRSSAHYHGEYSHREGQYSDTKTSQGNTSPEDSRAAQKTRSFLTQNLLLATLLASLCTALVATPAAQACEAEPVTAEQAAQQYSSPLDLSNITPAQQQQRSATVADRKQLLPYQFLSLYRCPSLTNSAVTAFEGQDYALALSLFDQAIAQRPTSLTRWLDRAIVHYYLGEAEAARSDAEQVRHRLSDLNFPEAQEAYRQLMTQLDGYAPDPRRARER